MSLIVTVAQAGAQAARAALRLGVPASVWADATPDDQQAALEAASDDLYAEPGAQIGGREADSPVQLATVVQALHLLHKQNNPASQERRGLQDEGVSDIQQGRTRESYRHRCALCGAARDLLRGHRGAVYLS